MPKKDPHSDRRCSNCHWWKEEIDPAATERMGTCHRFPPVPIYMDEAVSCVQPWTDATHVCGEHTAHQ